MLGIPCVCTCHNLFNQFHVSDPLGAFQFFIIIKHIDGHPCTYTFTYTSIYLGTPPPNRFMELKGLYNLVSFIFFYIKSNRTPKKTKVCLILCYTVFQEKLFLSQFLNIDLCFYVFAGYQHLRNAVRDLFEKQIFISQCTFSVGFTFPKASFLKIRGMHTL